MSVVQLKPSDGEGARSGSGSGVTYLQTKDFAKALKNAALCGGQAQKRQERVRVVMGSLDCENPFATLKVTNHGETRIKHCVKYDLGDGWRLVTRKTEKTCIFLFVGDHEDVDRWLDTHKGEDFGVKDNRLIRIPGIGSTIEGRQRVAEHHGQLLVDRLDEDSINHVLAGVPPLVAMKFAALDGSSSSEDLEALVAPIPDPDKQDLVRAVFSLLLVGDVDGAQAKVDFDRGDIAPIEAVDADDMISLQDGDEVRMLRVGSPEYESWLKDFEKHAHWHDWFLFLHPEQEKVVRADYDGVAQLSGVSGSGKTCVVVRRAMRLAQQEDARVLLLTLNRSLAGLLRQLVDAACVDEATRRRIEVTSFFELAQTLLATFEPENARRYEDVTWKLNEHVDEIFREYYRQWANNPDASVLLPLHKSMTARGVGGEVYVREEFDWIRSAVRPGARAEYLRLERKGRKFPISVDRRRELLQGLHGWEEKMRAVGVVDYLGLTSALTRHLDKIAPSYTHVLVDEAQDFGTSELRIVRRLVPTGPNDLFLCGDIAQTILPKHRLLADAGITGVVRERIQQNYRNSREILAAAYALLQANLHEEMFESEDLEILDPRFANFSGTVPMALAAETLEEEIAYARAYAVTAREQGARTVCIAFAGFSSRDIQGFATRCGVQALDGAYDPRSDGLVFSDLEQTKGYEFDTLIIVGCRDGVLPARDAPPEEQFRDACKLYVAMTRARRELILSYHGAASPWLREVSDTIETDLWRNCESFVPELVAGVPDLLPELDPNAHVEDAGALTGLQYLYTSRALELSLEAQDKLEELVDGSGARAAGRGHRVRWRNVRDLVQDLNVSRRQDNLFGPRVAEELRTRLRA